MKRMTGPSRDAKSRYYSFNSPSFFSLSLSLLRYGECLAFCLQDAVILALFRAYRPKGQQRLALVERLELAAVTAGTVLPLLFPRRLRPFLTGLQVGHPLLQVLFSP